MLEPRYTEGDIVEFRIEVLGVRSAPVTDEIVDGPYREGIWWEYTTRTGYLIRDHEIDMLVGRAVSSSEIVFDTGV
jgi:hypothetical protein